MPRMDIISPMLGEQIKEYEKAPLKVGMDVKIKGKYLTHNRYQDPNALNICTITDLTETDVIVENGYRNGETCKVARENVFGKSLLDVGYNPIPKEEWQRKIQSVSFSLETIYYHMFRERNYSLKIDGQEKEIMNFNWNPWVYNSEGNKEYFQRDFVWTLEDKQLFIESIYNRLNCGRVIVRKRSWEKIREEFKKGNFDIGFFEVIDGKQRLNCIKEFMEGKFPDSKGYYFQDFSERARSQFGDTQCLGYAEMLEESTDIDVIKTFLCVNFTGVPMSQEHIDYVKEIYKKM